MLGGVQLPKATRPNTLIDTVEGSNMSEKIACAVGTMELFAPMIN